jgi:ABC-type phosphate/phosphonate transport system substrate-binding protein
MKKLLVAAIAAAGLLGLAACSGSPTVKVRNDNSASVNVSFKPTEGSTVNIKSKDQEIQ